MAEWTHNGGKKFPIDDYIKKQLLDPNSPHNLIDNISNGNIKFYKNGKLIEPFSEIIMGDNQNTEIGRFLHQSQYIHAKVRRDRNFIKNKKRPILDIMKEDYAKDPKLWGGKLFGGKTVKELCENE